jgi:hypothetical protein
VSRNRLVGYEAALREVEWTVIECAGSVRERGREAAERVDATAVLATSDGLVLGVGPTSPSSASTTSPRRRPPG